MAQAKIDVMIPDELAGASLRECLYALGESEVVDPVLAHGGVWVNGQRVVDAMLPLPAGAQVRLHCPPDGQYATIHIGQGDVVYEDAWLLVLNKRAGWYTSATPWDVQGNVLTALTDFLQARDGSVPLLRVAHQLDRDTSGILLCTKDPQANAPLQAAFANQQVAKSYLCLCIGEPPEDVFELRTGHGRMRGGRWCLYDLEQVGMLLPNGQRVRFAHTAFVLERRLGDAALLHAHLYTGRTHQIRLHVASVGYPLVGDTRYGGPSVFRGDAVRWHLLHAAQVCIPHPVTGTDMRFVADLPGHMARYL